MFKKNILIISLFYLFFQSNVFANDKIAYMDFNYILNNSIIGKKILVDLSELNKSNIKNLKTQQDLLKKEIEEINKVKNISSQEDIKKKIDLHNKNVKAFDQLKKNLSNKLTKTKNDEMNKLVKLIEPLLENYMKENSIDIVLNKEMVYYSKEEYDISENILKLTNEKYK